MMAFRICAKYRCLQGVCKQIGIGVQIWIQRRGEMGVLLMGSGVARLVVSVVGGVLMVGACRWLFVPCYRVGRWHPVGEGVVHPK